MTTGSFIYYIERDDSVSSRVRPHDRSLFRWLSALSDCIFNLFYFIPIHLADLRLSTHVALRQLVRKTVEEEIEKKHYDIYISHTDDTLLKLSHLVAYLQERQLLPVESTSVPHRLTFIRCQTQHVSEISSTHLSAMR